MIKDKIIVMLGAPGAGKGTQARQLKELSRYPQISTGDILRSMAKSESALGKEISKILASGGLVDDDILAEVVRTRTSEDDCENGYILDGYPRTIKQAEQLENFAKEQNREVIVLNIDVDHDVLLKRLTGRRTCSNKTCGEIYNIYYKPPFNEGICDKCNSPLGYRADDRPEAIEKRLEEYRENTEPLINYYRDSNRLVSINGGEEPDKVFETICKEISSEKVVN